MARVLGVSRSGFYYWRTRTGPGPRAQAQAQLDELVAAAFEHFKGRYGAPRITRHLAEQGRCYDAKTVASSLRRQGLRAKAAKRFKATTDSNHTRPVAENVLEQDFTAERANEKWVGDITYLWTDEGWVYLAVILDLYSRQVIGWSMDKTMTAKLVCDALQMALWRRKMPPRSHRPYRPWQPVLLKVLSADARSPPPRVQYERQRQLLRQRVRRKLLPLHENRSYLRRTLSYPALYSTGGIRIHRDVLQHDPTTQYSRLHQPREIRGCNCKVMMGAFEEALQRYVNGGAVQLGRSAAHCRENAEQVQQLLQTLNGHDYQKSSSCSLRLRAPQDIIKAEPSKGHDRASHDGRCVHAV